MDNQVCQNYVPQDPLGLKLLMFYAPADFDLQTLGLSRIKSAPINDGRFFGQVWIIGESHVWQLVLPGNKSLVKILACVDIQTPFALQISRAGRKLLERGIVRLNDEQQLIDYLLKIKESEFCARGDYGLGQINKRKCLTAFFPAEKPGAPPARTIVAVHVEKNTFQCQSVHEYPNYNRAVITCSRLIFTK